MPTPIAAARAPAGNRAVGWMVTRCVWCVVARAAKKAAERAEEGGCAATTVEDYLAVLRERVVHTEQTAAR
jgi:hypothetical protein